MYVRPERVDFVRMAGLLDAIIVPFSAVGMSDSVNIILDQEGDSLFQLHFLLHFQFLLRFLLHLYMVIESRFTLPRNVINKKNSSDLTITIFHLHFTDIRQIPFMRDRMKGSGMPSARAGIEEDLLPPLFIPKAPERNYFLFGQVMPHAIAILFQIKQMQ